MQQRYKGESNMKRSLFLVGTTVAIAVSAQVMAADGKAVFEKKCKGCHTLMHPKFGDKSDWAPLIAQGVDKLTAVVTKGKKPMPPRGGAANEAEVKAAVEYIVSRSK
jgi:cytochrome c5